MRGGLTPTLRKWIERARPMAEALVIHREAVIQRADQWNQRDTNTNVRALSDGRLEIAPTTSRILEYATGTQKLTSLAFRSGGPVTVAAVTWGGVEPETFHLDEITARLDPDADGSGNVEVEYWHLQLFRVVREGNSIEGIEIAPVSSPVKVRAGASAGDVRFTFPAGQEPRPKAGGPPEVEDATVFTGRDPVTLVVIWATDGEGNPAGNVAWVMDSGASSYTTGGNTLTSHTLTAPPGGGSPTKWRITASSRVPRLSVVKQTFAAQTVDFTTNPLDLGAVPTNDVRFLFATDTPEDTSIATYVDDGASGWVAVTSGQYAVADLGLALSQTYRVRLVLDPGTPPNKTPAAISVSAQEVTATVLDGLATVEGGAWSIDPLTKKGEITEVVVRIPKDGIRDYRDFATLLLSSYDFDDIYFAIWYGHPDLDRADWLLMDVFQVDDPETSGPEIVFTCTSVAGILRPLALPVFNTVTEKRDPIEYANETPKAIWDDILTSKLAIDSRLLGPGVEDTGITLTNIVTESTALEELDAVAAAVGAGVITSQGRIAARKVHHDGGRRIAAVFPLEEIEVLAAGPGTRGRVPEFFTPYDFDFEEGNGFVAIHRSIHGNSVTAFDRAPIDAEFRAPDSVARWFDQRSTAQAYGDRITSTMGAGLILPRWISTIPHPELEPGDVVAVETDELVMRDPNTGREIRGRLWVIATLVAVTGVEGRDFTGWVQSFADILPTGTTLDDVGPIEDLRILDVREIERSETRVTFRVERPGTLPYVHVYAATAAQPVTGDPWPDPSTATAVATLSPAQDTFALDLPTYNTKKYVVVEGRNAALYPSPNVWRLELDPLDAEPPTIELDDSETASTGTQWVKVTSRGLPVSSVQFQTQVGNETPTAFANATRVEGNASVVKGGTLGPGEYEQDVELPASRFAWIIGKVTLENGEVIVLGPFGFDRNLYPTFVTVEVDGTKVRVIGDTDTDSIKVARTDGAGPYWTRSVDGFSHTFDLANPDPSGNAGIGDTATWTVEVTAYSDPVVARDADTLTATETVTVSGANAATAYWAVVSATAPAASDDDISITLDADLLGGAETLKVYERHRRSTSDAWAWVDITSQLVPSVTAPPASATTYTFDTPFRNNSSSRTDLVEYEIRAEIVSGGAVVDSETVTVKWYSTDVE